MAPEMDVFWILGVNRSSEGKRGTAAWKPGRRNRREILWLSEFVWQGENESETLGAELLIGLSQAHSNRADFKGNGILAAEELPASVLLLSTSSRPVDLDQAHQGPEHF